MKDKKFINEEVNIISEFVIKAKENPVVEAVYCVPYIEPKTNAENCGVTVVYNSSLVYLDKVSKIIGKELDFNLIIPEIEKIDVLCEEYNSKLKTSGFMFEKEDAFKFGATQMHKSDMLAKKDLISGKLIFDRFDDIKQTQVNILKFWDIEAYTNLSNIENIDDVKQQIKK